MSANVTDDVKPKPLVRLAAAVSRRKGLISICLYCIGVVGMLLLPLAGKAIYHDENALLVGHSESVIRSVICILHSCTAADSVICIIPSCTEADRSRGSSSRFVETTNGVLAPQEGPGGAQRPAVCVTAAQAAAG